MADRTEIKSRIRRIKNLPTLPGIIQKIAAMLDHPDTTPSDVGRLISQDQVLSAKVLRMANSAFFGMSRKISSINQALILLGFDVVKGLVLSSMVMGMMKKSMEGLWEHSIGCAAAAGVISARLGREDAEEVLLAGLLHDLGKVVLALKLPDETGKITRLAERKNASFYAAEKVVLEFNHGDVGLWLAEHWKLPVALAEPMRFHHLPHMASQAPDQTAIVHLADIIIRSVGFGFGGDPFVPPLSHKAWKRLGLKPSDFDGILNDLEPRLMNLQDMYM